MDIKIESGSDLIIMMLWAWAILLVGRECVSILKGGASELNPLVYLTHFARSLVSRYHH